MSYFLLSLLNTIWLIPRTLIACLLFLVILTTAVYMASFNMSRWFDHNLKPYSFPLVSRLEHSSFKPITSSNVREESIISKGSFDLFSDLNFLERDSSLLTPFSKKGSSFMSYNKFSIRLARLISTDSSSLSDRSR